MRYFLYILYYQEEDYIEKLLRPGWHHLGKFDKGKKLGLVKKNLKNNLACPSAGQLKFTSVQAFFHLIRPNFVSFYEVNFSCPALGFVSLFLSFFFAKPNFLPLFNFSGWCHLCTGHLKSLLHKLVRSLLLRISVFASILNVTTLKLWKIA